MMRLSASYAVKIAVVVGEGKEQKKKQVTRASALGDDSRAFRDDDEEARESAATIFSAPDWLSRGTRGDVTQRVLQSRNKDAAGVWTLHGKGLDNGHWRSESRPKPLPQRGRNETV